MTLKEIYAMFEVGQQWEAVNTYNERASGIRTLVEKQTTQLVWNTPQGPRSWMKLPKASQVIEAQDGYLSFRLFTDEEEVKYRKPGAIQATVTLKRITGERVEADSSRLAEGSGDAAGFLPSGIGSSPPQSHRG
jgi:hypothetical protein